MAGEIIRKGDPTSHNGVVLEGSLLDICMGQPIAYIGHKVHCPQCKGTYPDLKYHTVWFPIEYAATLNSNFVHVGNLSEGCVTMYELPMWNALYSYLIKNRLDKEGLYVGTVTIE